MGDIRSDSFYSRVGFSLPAPASFFLICAGDSAGAGYHLRVVPRPVLHHLYQLLWLYLLVHLVLLFLSFRFLLNCFMVFLSFSFVLFQIFFQLIYCIKHSMMVFIWNSFLLLWFKYLLFQCYFVVFVIFNMNF